MGLRKDHIALALKVNEVDSETQSNKRSIKLLEAEVANIQEDVKNLFRLSDEFRKEMDELSEKVAELYILKKVMAEQKEFVEQLAGKFELFSHQVNDHMSESTKSMTDLQDGFKETQFQLREMKDYVDHFADNLVLNSQQITVDTYAGFSSKPITLTEVLKMCNTNFEDVTTVNNTQNEQITKIFNDLETKAPDSVLFNITTLEKKVGTIELHIQKEEEQGMGALRKQCEELSVHMQTMSAELADKIDRDSVGFIVHEKYEEIVRYLQDALQSSLEDENNFKEKADEIQEMVILLSNSKADRTEIANMQEMMVKSEALLKKFGANANLKEKIKDFISKKEVEALLANKIDRNEFEEQLNSALNNSRRNRKLASLSTSLNVPPDRAMTSGLVNYSSDLISPNLEIPQQRAVSPNGNDSGFKQVLAFGRPNSASGYNPNLLSIDPPAPHSQAQVKPIPVIAIGQGIGNSPRRSPDFGTYLKMKGKGGKGLTGSSSTPNIEAPPGAFRKATEGGKPGGQVVLHSESAKNPAVDPEGYGATEYPFSDPQYKMNYADQSKLTDHLAYLHGPIVGGGFNVRNAHLMKNMPAGRPVAADDVEGKGMMLKGQDGHFYYTDSANSTAK
eukprot:CAMPEP_0173150978 /NCGR_PEP_ID=MMETSP1105-20130129/11295_1 /TAXON_ID=2985 /ORGANISM="Ochromonas sp., Strain BG-1" /LENGTH=618 /DNA_ID=CAMNT_0014066243 /DNA_START=79 /DNA_END=1935 /DNA_ORIENTATION=-